ncbi:MAG TPA: prolipoprotein diacylglyceryl transferase family protein, partial [Acidimicrobiales bacterium]|nr:prolipoprotein diacylglyceryl transferase family protein [Acidimicrobiales bacterium]
ELFGRPSKLPWALRVDPAYRPKGFAQYATFHPTFLYESLWDLAVVGLLLLAERKLRIRRGYLFVLYVALYTFGRFWTEYLRIDFAHKFLGLRLNDWVSILIFAAATLLLVLRGRIRSGEADGDGGAGSDGGDPGEAAAVAVRGAEEPGPARATAESADQAAPGPGPGPAEP